MWALDYRPKVLDDVLDQEIPKKIISGALRKKNSSRSWLVTGPHGSGKTTLVRIIGKGLTCPTPQPSGEGCGVCYYCEGVDKESSSNYAEVDAATFGSAEKIRYLVQEARISPTGESPNRVIALDEVHSLSLAAQDVLLKTLEETPETTYFILLTTDPQKLKSTVLSRCLQIRLNPVGRSSLLQQLKTICEKENVEYDEEGLNLIISSNYGHARDILTLAETVALTGSLVEPTVKEYLGLNLKDEVGQLVKLFLQDWKQSFEYAEQLCNQYDPSLLWRVIRDLLVEASLVQKLPHNTKYSSVSAEISAILGQNVYLSEWILSKSKEFAILTTNDLLVALSLALYQAGILQQTSHEVPVLNKPFSNESSNPVSKSLSPEEFFNRLGFVEDSDL